MFRNQSYNSLKAFLLAVVLLLGVGKAEAAMYTVHNIAGFDADFYSIQDAINGASAGDTIYLHGSPLNFGAAAIDKPLCIFASGFFLNANDTTLVKKYAATVTTLDFNVGSSGTVVYGLTVAKDVDIKVDDIKLMRCHIFSGEQVLVDIKNNVSNILVAQCIIHLQSNTSSSSYRCISLTGNNNLIQIVNNLIIRGNSDNGSYDYAIYSPSNSFARITNNVIVGSWETHSGYINNNIHASGDFSGQYNSLFSNISHSTWFGTNQGNLANVSMSSVFLQGLSGQTYDMGGYWELAGASVAIGAGQGGSDCGVFSGNLSWKRSGLAPIPAIFDASIPSSGSATSGMDIILNIKSHR